MGPMVWQNKSPLIQLKSVLQCNVLATLLEVLLLLLHPTEHAAHLM